MGRCAAENGFQRDVFEKVYRLKETLKFLNTEPILKEHLLLKGGTAINLTIFDLPRLSVDIDLDYIPNDSRENMLKMRKEISSQLKDYMELEGYFLGTGSRKSYSLDAFHFQYVNSSGNRDMIKIEINYSLRAHVLEADTRKITTNAFGQPIEVMTVSPMEIFAAKANALMSRAAARDLYDFNNFVQSKLFLEQRNMLRKVIIFYASVSAEEINKSFDTSVIDRITFRKIKRDLFPMLKKEEIRNHFDLDKYKNVARTYIDKLMQATDSEKEYMNCFEKGIYAPELLFEDKVVIERVKNHPMILWKIAKKIK